MTVPAVYFLSDYGTADEFAGVVRAVLHRLAPATSVVDLGHDVPAFDVAAGAAMLERCAPYLGDGVVLAVVDPGVGSARRAVAVRVGSDRGSDDVGEGTRGAGGPSWLVGPDNGLLVPLARALGGVREVVALAAGASPAIAPAARPASGVVAAAGGTFDGRDLFAPAVAHLVEGRDVRDLGEPVDPGSLVTLPAEPSAGSGSPDPARSASGVAGALDTTVTWIDRFGNVQLGIGQDDLAATGLVPGGAASVDLGGGTTAVARWVTAFAELGPAELGLLIDANGRVSLVVDRDSAADRLGLTRRGASVRLAPSSRSAPG